MARKEDRLNREQIVAIHERSKTYALPSDIKERITGSTLDEHALRFIGTLIEVVHPTYWMEFGSGLSTFFTARLLSEDPAACITSVDHSDYYLAQTQDVCRAYTNVTYFHAPISLYHYNLKRFLTYKLDYVAKIPDEIKFDVVLIDGPLGFRYGREAPLYQIAAHLKPTTLIVLDDASRDPEQRAMANWQRVWGNTISIEFFPGTKGLAVIQIDEPYSMERFPFPVSEMWKSWWRVQEGLKSDGYRPSALYVAISFWLSNWNKARKKYQKEYRKLRSKIRGLHL